jgi:hypothetical protein
VDHIGANFISYRAILAGLVIMVSGLNSNVRVHQRYTLSLPLYFSHNFLHFAP